MPFTKENPARILAVVAHQDDFEFNAGGTFIQLRERYGDAVMLKIIITSTGASGHHEMDADATFRRRMQEASDSASMIEAEVECLTQLDGTHVAGQVLVNRNLLGGLWNAIRSFRTDYLFCPPAVSDPLAAVHVDHEETARAIRLLGYQLNVPRAYPTIGKPAVGIEYRSPLILLMDDPYNSERHYGVANPIPDVFSTKVSMSQCHRSQVFEWLPFARGQNPPTAEKFAEEFRLRHSGINQRYGFDDKVPREFFRISRWGRRANPEDLTSLFPKEAVIA